MESTLVSSFLVNFCKIVASVLKEEACQRIQLCVRVRFARLRVVRLLHQVVVHRFEDLSMA